MEMFDMASRVEFAAEQSEQICDLITIVLTEVFDACYSEDDCGLGKLLPYEYSFNTVLIAAIDFCNEQKKSLNEVKEQLYKLSRESKGERA